MSAKQAKRERQRLRSLGIEPDVDKKRREHREEIEAEAARLEARERFKREHPEEYEAQQAAARRRSERAMRRVGVMMAAMAGFLG